MGSANWGGLLGDIKTMNPGQGRWSMPGRQNTVVQGSGKKGLVNTGEDKGNRDSRVVPLKRDVISKQVSHRSKA